MGALISALATFLGGTFSAHHLATKIVFIAAFTLILPIVLFNASVDLAEAIFNIMKNRLPVPPGVIQFTGLAGWLLSTLHLPEAVSVIVSSRAGRMAMDVFLKAV